MALSSFPPPPESLRNDPAVLQWLVALVNTVLTPEAAATVATLGLVKQGTAVTDAAASSVAVVATDAPAQGVGYVQADVQAIADLANELKTDVNQLVTDLNAVKDQLNALLASDRSSGQIVP